MFAKIEQRTAPFPPDWSQAPPQRLFAFIRYYCRGFYAPLVIIMLAGIGVAVPLFKRLGLGSVLGYLAAGLAIGPFGLKLVTDSHAIIHIAEFGVVMFLFVIGLEMKPSHLWGLRRQIFGLGSLQVVVCAFLLTGVGLLYGFPWQVSFVGAAGFVLFSGALGKGVIDETANANMTAIVVLSMVFTPLMIILHNRFAKAEEMETRAADTIHEQKPIIVIGMGRFGQAINKMLNMSGYETTIIDMDPVMVQGFTKYGVKTHFGDASRHELLIAAGIEKAQMLVVAIDNREQALQIVRFAREINPNIKILARAFDRLHTFDLYQAGADEIVREVFDSAIRAGKTTLKMLGMKKDIAEKLATYYFHSERNKMVKLARVHASALGPFQNQQMIEISQAYDLKMEDDIAAIMRGEDAPDPRGEADEDD